MELILEEAFAIGKRFADKVDKMAAPFNDSEICNLANSVTRKGWQFQERIYEQWNRGLKTGLREKN